MTAEQIQARVIHDSIAIDTIYSVKYQVLPSQSIVQQGWFRKEYIRSTTVEERNVETIYTYEFHYHDFGNLVVLPLIEIVVSATTPNRADSLSSMFFKCKGNENGTATISYSPEKETLSALQNELLFDKAILKICNDFELNLEKGALGYFISEVNQTESLENSTREASDQVPTIGVGDYIKFGRYPQGANGEVEDIEWLVLEKENDTALVISKYALECQKYTESFISNWADSTLRSFLNNQFIQAAFNSEELLRIVDTECCNEHKGIDIQSEPSTVDKVFCLSIEEAEQFFDSEQKRATKPTKYAEELGAVQERSTDNCLWWLRSTGDLPMNYSNVDFNGVIRYNMFLPIGGSIQPMLSRYYAVRPAMRIKV